MSKIKVNGKEWGLKDFITETLGKSDSANFRDVDSAMDYITNILQFSSNLLVTLYEKKILSSEDIKKILNQPDIHIEK